MDRKDLQVQTLADLGSLWQSIKDVKKTHGVGPGESNVTAKNSKGSRSLRKTVEREANKCLRGFTRMATIVRRTENIIEEELESLES